ncbi:MAG: helix-turn-helix domain-containing protein [Alphaproteobacteria bacterium]|nr:helix-turn-helix domain-containing protein [Alphaproteobacteria bacterium]
MKKTGKSKLTKALLETADGMHRTGILSDAAHAKITKRHLDAAEAATVAPLSPREIRSLRENAKMSQAVFAHYLHLTTGYVSQLERGIKHPKGPALVLLNVIRRKGMEAIL